MEAAICINSFIFTALIVYTSLNIITTFIIRSAGSMVKKYPAIAQSLKWSLRLKQNTMVWAVVYCLPVVSYAPINTVFDIEYVIREILCVKGLTNGDNGESKVILGNVKFWRHSFPGTRQTSTTPGGVWLTFCYLFCLVRATAGLFW